ncbi:MAG: bifunctional folylpolyglutamate synthase/dihydrofolate synthase [bacterium]|nr:bifunctional folylpolyglutamate synthase/dihydrofolate synthase [bacterium]
MDAYADTIAWLLGLEVARGWDLKLERMRAALALRGNPERRFASLHVAGTNGKGSTAAMLESVLRASGRRTGLYTSPHLVDFSERIRAGGETIPRHAVVALVAELRAAVAAADLALTHFEFATLLGFEWFARIGVEVAVVEVGLGGRLDATNCIAPLGTAITAIAHDHEAWLGETLAAIAAEKAGIVKPGVPMVTGVLPPEAAAVVAERAASLGAPILRAGVDGELVPGPGGDVFRGPGGVCWDGLHVALPGAFQRENAAVALTLLAALRAVLPCDAGAVRRGLAGVEWPGRLAVVAEAPRVVIDGAHNPAAIDAVLRELPRLAGDRPVTLVFAVMADKAWRAMLATLVPRAARVIVTRVGRRGLDPTALAGEIDARIPVRVEPEPRAAVAAAIAETPRDGVILVVGSLFLAGEAYAALGTAAAGLFRPWHAWRVGGTEAPP